MPGRRGFGLPRETKLIVATLGAGTGIAIGIVHKVENIFFKRLCGSPISIAIPIAIPILKGYCYWNAGRTTLDNNGRLCYGRSNMAELQGN
jgi:hypothetical protein